MIDFVVELIPEWIQVNGVEQSFLFRLQENSNPVLLWFHGGPGSTLMPWTEAFDNELFKDFSTVHWDQRGAGKTFAKQGAETPLTLEQMTEDAVSVLRIVKTRIGARPLVLVGHSWGTYLALQAAKMEPRMVDHLVLVGTLVNLHRADEIKLEFLLSQFISDEKVTKQLEKLKPPFESLDDVLLIGRLLAECGKTFGNLSLEKLGLLSSSLTIYIEKDWEYQELGAAFSVMALFPRLATFDALHLFPKISVPVTFIQGGADILTPTNLVKEFFENVHAPKGKCWIEFNECAHFPMWEQPETFARELKKSVSGLMN